jgi:hypothetical protein
VDPTAILKILAGMEHPSYEHPLNTAELELTVQTQTQLLYNANGREHLITYPSRNICL